MLEDAHVLGEHVVAVDADLGEVAHAVELEDDLDGRRRDRVVLPPDPLVPETTKTPSRHGRSRTEKLCSSKTSADADEGLL